MYQNLRLQILFHPKVKLFFEKIINKFTRIKKKLFKLQHYKAWMLSYKNSYRTFIHDVEHKLTEPVLVLFSKFTCDLDIKI